MISSYDFQPGRILAGKYEVLARIGSGWEGEVYHLRETETGIERAAKFYFPKRNPKNKAARFYAQKLHKLRDCGVLINYHTQEKIRFRRQEVTFLVSDFAHGTLLSKFLESFHQGRLPFFEALHLLHALARGVGQIHQLGDYHGDIHTDNIIVIRRGIGFDIKLIDLFHWGVANQENMLDDVCNLIKVFHEVLGGPKYYKALPAQARQICCGLRRTLIRKKFRNAHRLREFLEAMPWQ